MVSGLTKAGGKEKPIQGINPVSLSSETLIVVSIYIQGEPGIKFYGIDFVLICVGFFYERSERG